MQVYFTKNRRIEIYADRWAESSGIILFYDEDNNIVASMSAFRGLRIVEGQKETRFLPESMKEGGDEQ